MGRRSKKAFGKGGASETVIDGVTGLHFWEQSVPAICDVVQRFETEGIQFDPVRMRAHVERFSTQRFRNEFREFVEARWAEHQSKLRLSANRTSDGSQRHLARVAPA